MSNHNIEGINCGSLIIVIHEIYGVNEHILTTTKNFKKMGFGAICPNLYDQTKPFPYSLQREAYLHFNEKVGFKQAASKVRELSAKAKKEGYRKVFLCGFSVGATICWLCSKDRNIDGVIGFYGSRIRDYSDIYPSCPTLLIFPKHEEAFDVISFAASIDKPGVHVKVLDGCHGFADSFSYNYNEKSHLESEELVNKFLATI